MTQRRPATTIKPWMTALLMAAMASAAMFFPAPGRAQTAVSAPWPIDEFCGRAQTYVTLTDRPVRNVLHEDRESFLRASASVQPLESHQHTVIDEAGGARIVSCKLVTAEALRAAYGAAAARSDSSCSLVNRNTFSTVLASLTPAERAGARFDQGKRVSFDRDAVVAAADEWLEPGELATVDKRGALHLTARSWTGTAVGRSVRHCQFIAPDFARRMLLDSSLALPAMPVKR
jgi:hypothetical protein